jgi:hypothetical protein
VQRREEPVYRYSGAPSWNPSALRDALANTRSVRLSRGGFQIFATSPDADVLDDEIPKYVSVVRKENGPLVEDPLAIAELIEAVTVTEVTDLLCMCTGDAATEFFDGDRKLIAVVRFDLPNRIEWPHWPGLARIADPDRLSRWFATHYAIKS